MNTVELLQYSLDTAFNVLGMVTEDLTQEMADWQPPGVASSITANYSHVIKYADSFFRNILIPGDDSMFHLELPPEICMHELQADLSDLHQQAREVRAAYNDWVSTRTPEDLDVVMNTNVGRLNVGQTVEIYIVWHINVHCGEISTLKGCQGAKGYPW